MLQLPNAERREEKALGASEGSNRRHLFLHWLSAIAFPGTAALRLGLADTARGFTDGEMASVVHGALKKQLASHRFPLVHGSVLLQLARSCLRIENSVA